MSKEYFKSNPQIELLYETSDGFLFEKQVDAKQHAKTLKDADIKEVRAEQTKKVKKTEASEPEKTIE